jgi:transposase
VWLLRLGELTPVRVPGEGEEAVRDLVRAREDARGDLMRARHRLSKLLLRHGLLWERTAWSGEHDRWLRGLRFDGALAVCFDESYGGVLQARARRDRLDQAIFDAAALPAHAEAVARLACLRGVSTLTALALTVELGDWRRFDRPASARSSASSRASTRVAATAGRARSPRPATGTRAGCWSRRPGISGGHYGRASR